MTENDRGKMVANEQREKPFSANESTPDEIGVALDAQDAQTPEGNESDTTANDKDSDSYYAYLVAEHHRFRTISLVFAIIGFSLITAAVSLSVAGILTGGLYNIIMSIANFFIILTAIVFFTKTRPFKRRMKDYTGEPKSTVTDPEAPDGVRMEDPKFRDTDDMYKILERKVRTEVVPDTQEYHRLRRAWLAMFAAAGVIAVFSLALFYFYPESNVVATLILLTAFVLVIIAFYIDRTRMRPLRTEWARQRGMTEMQYRDNMH